MQKLIIITSFLMLLFFSLYTSPAFAQIGWGPATNLGSNINTADFEDGHSLSTDSSKLYFATNRSGGIGEADIWVSEYIGNWQMPVCLSANVNSTSGEHEPCISNDGKKLYFSSFRPGGYGDSDIYMSENIGGVWQPAVNLGSSINSLYSEACPFLSADTMQLYFTSDRPGGYGLIDIWVSVNSSGLWQTPTNMGNVINTSNGEHSAYLFPDGLTLYFASDRGGGFGDWDIWQSTNSGGVWQPPMNLGPNINTISVEVAPVVSSNGQKLYFCALDWPGGFGDYDIWVSEFQGGVEEQTTRAFDAPKLPTMISGPLMLPHGKACKVFNIGGRTVNPIMLNPGIYFVEIEGNIAQKVIKVR